ncbi:MULTISPECIES: CBS domain-containing protein [Nitrosomonas]|uniref:CBS domain n=1 Tax=Nitrosomonas europaea (strain ATCC 19718 / CIP 103999 / KCTC 2705 / NBRC 14298) TaxID=228410 RepID=Q82WX9_NITEU|nr:MULTISPECIES: CBS domain-containing protein [Nitrosomonas]MBV6390120.1 Inosine-5'-monophosphate dehydrogenase [Nitrosomonas europaea]MEB2332563.1 CBS domain-containing protein [Nitrosomonas sp.]QOJ09228.1 MAG: CBS domain-containing protein [Nitrosomonas sp. H1_AOB3]CAD84436.1 CBS domain [Nitrosomonas europaea ATCC 19718]SDW41177.1 acetoin utilization protein AcuB [Nitrosomonas europaea]
MSTKLELPIQEFTTPYPVTAREDSSIEELLDLIKNLKVRHIPIMSDGKVTGIVSERDLKIISALSTREKFLVRAADLMTPDPIIFRGSTSIEDVILKMSEKKIGSVLVSDEQGNLQGIFTVTDALDILVEILRGKK